jgi:glutamate 5-kinase
MREGVSDVKRLVLKLGTRVLTENDNTLSSSVLRRIVGEAAELIRREKEIVIVSSGAIALGLSRIGLDRRPREINLLQAAASLGQSRLMQAYETEFKSARCETAQILLTLEDIQNRDRYLNIRNTILTLWEYGAVPIVNENDTVSFEEITFGDNDILAAHLAIMIDADLLVLLTDIDGLYDRDPKSEQKAEIIKSVKRVDADLIKSASGKGSSFSSGGMESKLRAAQIATRGGIGAVIANGKSIDLIGLLEGGEIGTFFVPAKKKIRGRKKWIAFNPNVEGKIIIDAGGERAITKNRKSLLPAGVIEIVGTFGMGSNVSILNEKGREVARGLTNFSSGDLNRIKGLQTSRIGQVLGSGDYFEEVVHRDNMVVLQG